MKIHTGDSVVVISGKDKGKTGTVLRVLDTTHRLVVGDINMRTKHVKAMPNRPGQIVRYEASIDVSNVMLLDPKTKKRSRIGFSIGEKGKSRISKRSGEVIKGVKAAKPKAAAKTEEKAEKDTAKTTEAKAVKAEETTKKEKAEKAPKAEKVAGPAKKPFWKKLGFGADAIDEEGAEGKAVTGGDIPDQATSSNQSHSRGN